MMSYWQVWQWYAGQLEEHGRPLSQEEALAFFEESGGVIVHPAEVPAPEEMYA